MSSKKDTVLIIEDESSIRKLLTISLESGGYKTVECDNGKEGLRLSVSTKPSLILLDMGLPDIDGMEVIGMIREWSITPIIVCSVRNSDEEIIHALEKGADDYVTKPFNPDVLLARINANLRKAVNQEAGEPQLTNGNIRMDLIRHEVFLSENKLDLTPKEYELLRYFLVNRGKMLTHKQILKDIWGAAHADSMQYLRVYVSQLRDKIERNSSTPEYIITEPGIGYRMELLSEQTSTQIPNLPEMAV